MNNDLISRSKLLNAIDSMYKAKKDIVPDNFAEGCMQMEKLIKLQPTAYDVDKVVEEIKETTFEQYYEDYYLVIDVAISTIDAIDIVERGGVDG